MNKTIIFSLFVGALAAVGQVAVAQSSHQYTVLANKPGATIQPTMYGVFFEDINYGADGGLYADLVENRSFEFPQRLMGWQIFGNAEVEDDDPAFERNPHYIRLKDDGHTDKWTGIENRGYFGMGFKKGLDYKFGVYARSKGKAKIRVELVSSHNEVIERKRLEEIYHRTEADEDRRPRTAAHLPREQGRAGHGPSVALPRRCLEGFAPC